MIRHGLANTETYSIKRLIYERTHRQAHTYTHIQTNRSEIIILPCFHGGELIMIKESTKYKCTYFRNLISEFKVFPSSRLPTACVRNER